MKKFKKILALSLAAVTAAAGVCLTACNFSGQEDDPYDDDGNLVKDVTIKFLNIWPEHQEIFDEIIEDFTNEHPHILVDHQQSCDYTNVTSVVRQDYQAGDLADVFFFWTHQTNLLVNDEVQIADDISDMFEDEEYYHSFMNEGGIADMGVIGGKYYNVPLRMTGHILIYNKSMFDEFGIENAPATLEELEETLGVIKAKGANKNIIPLSVYGNTGTFPSVYYAMLRYIEVLSGTVNDPAYYTGILDKSSEEYLDAQAAALDKAAYWYDAGYIGSGASGKTEISVQNEFMNGSCAIAFINNNRYPEMKAELAKEGVEVGAIAFPAPASLVEQGEGGYVSGGVDGFSIARTSKHKKEARIFLKYLTSRAAMEKFTEDAGSVMARSDVVYKNEDTKALAETMKGVGKYERFSTVRVNTTDVDGSYKSNRVSAYISGSRAGGAKELCKSFIATDYRDMQDPLLNNPTLEWIAPTPGYIDFTKAETFIAWLKKR